MRKISKTAKLAVAGVSVGTLALSGVAYAYWSTTGSGTGTAATSAGQTDNLGFSATTLDGTAGHVVDGLAPGIAAKPFQSTVTNNSSESAYVAGIKAYLTVAQAAGAVGTCDATDYMLGANAASLVAGQVMPGIVDPTKAVALSWTAKDLAHSDTGVVAGSIQFNNKTGASGVNQDGCKGATVTIHYLAS